MVGTVVDNLTNLTRAETVDGGNWDDVGGGQGSSQNSDLPIEGAETRARRVDGAQRGFGYDNGSGVDISAAGTHVGIWFNVLQPGQINPLGLELSLSDSGTGPQSGNWDGHVFTAADYPATGGWVRGWIDPTRTRDQGSGTLSLTNVRGYGINFDMGNVGGNAPNCHIDRIDYTASGLTLNAGTVGSPATFADLSSYDLTNAIGIFDGTFLSGPITIGGANSYFEDENFAIQAGNQPLASADWLTITFDLSSATSDLNINSGFLSGIGLAVSGSLGSVGLGTLVVSQAPAITLNGAVTWAGSIVASDSLTAGGAALNGITVDGSTGTSGLIWDTNVDTNGLLDDAAFNSAGTGHGLELGTNSPLTITLDGVNFTGYATVDGSTGNEAIWVRRTVGTVTINVIGGSTPSIRTDGATVNVVANPVTTLITVRDVETGLVIENARVYVVADTGGPLAAGTEIINDLSDVNGQASDTRTFASDQPITGRVRLATAPGPYYKTGPITGTINSNSGFSLVVQMIRDE